MGDSREIREIRVASSIGVLLIVFGHSFITADYVDRNPLWYRAAKDVIYGFHIHLFFFLSGFLLAYRNEDRPFSGWAFCRSRFIRLIVPYLFYSLVNVMVNILLPGVTHHPVESVGDVLNILAYPATNTIKFHWFLVVAFNLSLMVPIVLLVLKRSWLAVVICGVFVVAIHLWLPKRLIMCWGISATGYYLVFFFLGAVAQRRIGLLSSKKYSEHPLMTGGVALLVSGILYWVALMLEQEGVKGWRVSIIGLLFSLSAIGFVLAVSRFYVVKAWCFLGALSGLNLSILLLSWYGHRLADGLLNRLLGLGFSFVMPISFILGIFVPFFVVAMIKGRSRWSDVLIGYSAIR